MPIDEFRSLRCASEKDIESTWYGIFLDQLFLHGAVIYRDNKTLEYAWQVDDDPRFKTATSRTL